MRIRTSILSAGLIGCMGAGLLACEDPFPPPSEVDVQESRARGGFEVWIADQSDTAPGHGGQLLIFEGSDLMGSSPGKAEPIARINLAESTTTLCEQSTGARPTRPHMVLFNRENTHAILSFVASGHVVIFDAETREPLSCMRTTQSSGGLRQAHAAFPAPDGSYILIANQSGKQLERINTNFVTNEYTHDAAATLDLAMCTTPNGDPCEHPDLRPINWPICPIIDASSQYGFVTLRGGGMFVVNPRTTPISIVAEYDSATIKGNGCGGVQVDNAMFINSGGSPVMVGPGHPAIYGFDVYRFPLTGFSATRPRNEPAPELLLSEDGMADSHGLATAGGNRYVWVMDRHADVVEIIEVATGQRVNTVNLNGALTGNAAPDLTDVAPGGNRIFVSLRGPTPLSGDPHNAMGDTPGLGVLRVTNNGRSGSLMSIVPITNPWQQPNQNPDPHGMRVRVRS